MTLRIATWNVLDLFEASAPEFRGSVERKLEFLVTTLRRADADVVAFQEIGGDALFAELLARSGYPHVIAASPDHRGIRCAIASRRPFLEATVHEPSKLTFPKFFSADPEPFAGRLPARRGVPHVTLAGSAGPIHLFAVHFKSKLGAWMKDDSGEPMRDESLVGLAEASLRSLVQRSAEALYVRRLVDACWQRDRAPNVAVLGDFNDTSASMPVQIVEGLSRAGAPHPEALHSVWPLVPAERRFSVMHRGEPEGIDHALLSASLFARATAAGVFNEGLSAHDLPYGGAPPEDSDHALLWFDLAVDPAT